ncbi:hypothetical protein F511_05305 [Dorcoceras hygrometricum]|uniref:Uncharacterized protein n=1 Tax=Dorcoceras hygrometricum TaxID=472368 RepID=A0A2Z7BYG3_9LAMI|nr:hypothetical protein F511_05305 [Dorcoceras hygrometricum]
MVVSIHIDPITNHLKIDAFEDIYIKNDEQKLEVLGVLAACWLLGVRAGAAVIKSSSGILRGQARRGDFYISVHCSIELFCTYLFYSIERKRTEIIKAGNSLEEEYGVWKIRMQAHLAAQDDDMWCAITDGPIKNLKSNTAMAISSGAAQWVEKPRLGWTSEDKKKANLDKDNLYKMLDNNMFSESASEQMGGGV